MGVTELSVKKPLGVLMVVLFVMGLGVYGYNHLGADLLPSIDTPYITIFTTYPGASADEIEKEVAKPIEDAVSGVSGIETVRSVSNDGYCYNILKFSMSTNLNNAFNDVQQAIASISGDLPKDASRPVVMKYNKDAMPVLILTISGSVPYDELYNAANEVKQKIEKVDGVGEVSIEGAYKKQLLIALDRTKMDYYGITPSMVANVIQSSNVDIPTGKLDNGDRSETIKIAGEFKDINDVKNLRIPLLTGDSIPLSEIADVSLKYPPAQSYVRDNGKTAIGIFIKKQSDANIVETTDRVKKDLEAIQKELPKGVKVNIASDSSKFINATLKEIKRNLIEGVITTAVVMLLFLGQLRSSFIVLVAIPTSLIATFFMMYVFHFTLNLLSLLALSVSIGILVDDSIVIIENIERHIKRGEDPIHAAINGRREIAMAAIAITLCDIVVFGPVAFMSDMVGKFFREFGLTVVFATSFSLAVSFTLTPMLASRVLKSVPNRKAPDREGYFQNKLKALTERYRRFLIWSIDNRWKIVSLVLIAFIASILLIPLNYITAEFLPNTDQSAFTINLRTDPNSSINRTDTKVKAVERYLKSLPEVKDFISQVGIQGDPSTASITVNLVDKRNRKLSQSEVAEKVREYLASIPGIDASVTENSLVGRTSEDSDKPVAVNVTGDNIDVVRQIAKKVEDIVRTTPGTRDVDSTAMLNQSEVNIKIDPAASAFYNIRPGDIYTSVKAASNEGASAGIYRANGDEYEITVKYSGSMTPYDIGTIKISNSTGQQVRLNQVARIYTSDSPPQKLRLNKRELVTVSANVSGRPLGSITQDIKEKIDKLQIPPGYEITLGGDQQNMATSFDSLIKALIISVILVYMILVVLYESFLTPFLRMLSLPCGAIGALVALAITGKSLNIVSLIGIIMLDGLASKNGTLLIDYTNTLMKRGLAFKDALIEAGTTRLRPILMTSITMIAGMLPAALALNEGSEVKSGMAVVLIGGLITSTVLTPVLIPVVYAMLDDLKKKVRGHRSLNQGVEQ
ncbi:efflux RND transporter permease subunit [Caldanaerobius polysaccharolyticus]|uniref:efflux RND transporter permease subunit n=1 Tax=Caldanaerobius polysaccharolyticus TaxID=44256 RepID=UPI00047947E3|nr:efflux RND transporter permease subunit [Caldanaerobius polysaccharolyticus]